MRNHDTKSPAPTGTQDVASRHSDGVVAINYSGGASSRWQIEAVIEGVIERPRHVAVFFADTGDEHVWTYEDVAQTRERCAAAGIPFFTCSDTERLSDDMLAAARGQRTRTDNSPLWTESQGGSPGQLIQKCTKRFKRAALRREQSRWLASMGLPKKITVWIGFGADESMRATKALAQNDVQWSMLDFPAVRLGKNRGAQRADLDRWIGGGPRFSMCVHCPFKTSQRWFQTSGDDLTKAIELDEAVRHGLENAGVHDTCFVSNRLIPLEQLIRKGDPQPSLPGLESYCDSGVCFV